MQFGEDFRPPHSTNHELSRPARTRSLPPKPLIFGCYTFCLCPMELRHLRYFVMAAEERNISRASARLFVSQPSVSRQIKDLEDEFGVKLFLREPNGLRLTEAGTSALARAREILRQANALTEAMDLLARRDAGVVLRVGFLPIALPKFLTEALRRFHQEHPTIQVDIFDMTPVQQAEALGKREIDLALIGEASAAVRRDFQLAPIFSSPMAMIMPDDHPLSGRKSVRLDEFADDPFVTLHEDQFPDRPQLMDEMFTKAGFRPDVILRARGLTELIGLVGGGGSGVAFAPAELAILPHHGAVFIPLKHPQRTLTFSVAWHKDEATPEMDALLKAIRECV